MNTLIVQAPDPQMTLFSGRIKVYEDAFAGYLRAAGRWMSAREYLVRHDVAPTESNRRWLRGLAEKSADVISGQRGYCHVECATVEELNHASAWLISQGRKMMLRGLRIRRVAHGRIA